jgi:hypothetical protein
MSQKDEVSGGEGSPFTHVFCAVVHENLDCAVDLVRNLRFFEPASAILVYDGTGGSFLPQATLLERLGAVLHPAPRPMKWGRLHECVFDVFEYAADSCSFDALTFVDSDQLLTRRGYVKAVRAVFDQRPGAGVLAMPNPSIGKEWGVKLESKERALWESFLERFPSGSEQHFPSRWIFWPGTVFSRACADAIREFRSDAAFIAILERSGAVSEEIGFSTLAALLGYGVFVRPWNDEWVRWRQPLRVSEVAAALADPDCFWLHPVKRQRDDPARVYLRRSSNDYQGFTPTRVQEQPGRTSQRGAATSTPAHWKQRLGDRFFRRLGK